MVVVVAESVEAYYPVSSAAQARVIWVRLTWKVPFYLLKVAYYFDEELQAVQRLND